MTRSDTLKKWSGRGFLVSFALFISTGAVLAWPVDPVMSERRCSPERRDVDVVLCLDTSGSMEGLIDSARARLWDVVNSLAQARPTPRLRVGLLTYGSPSRSSASRGWIVRQCDLTSDLDTVYAKMMAMTIDGGDEFVGWVLNDAVTTMDWSNDPRALRLIFVAGNESADASDVYNFRNVARAARVKDITINSIFAGPYQGGVSEHWDQVAACGGGSYSAIDMRCGTVQIETPQDKLLLELNLKLNATYLPFGSLGAAGAANQIEQDHAAKTLGAASEASRVEAKASVLYDNAHWDLVDAVAQGRVQVAGMKKEELPAPLQSLPPAEREAYVKKVQADRARIQEQITQAQRSRERFLRDARAQAAGGKAALDQVMEKALREQAKAKGFHFEKSNDQPE